VANPPMSNYFVKSSIGLNYGESLPAGNFEYGLCAAIHGEECCIAVLRSRYGKKLEDPAFKPYVLAFAAQRGPLRVEDFPENIPSCCGNCRDILFENFGKDLEIVDGHPDGGLIMILPMSLCLVDEFEQLWPPHTSGIMDGMFMEKILDTIELGNRYVYDHYSPDNAFVERRYYARIVTKNGDYVGAHDIGDDYHPVYAIRNAVIAARRANDPFVQQVFVVNSDGNKPHVMYRDRQALAELNYQAEAITGASKDPLVCLVAYNQQDCWRSAAWLTSVKSWLPFWFGPHKFGKEFEDWYQQRVREHFERNQKALR